MFENTILLYEANKLIFFSQHKCNPPQFLLIKHNYFIKFYASES